jgi:hypothetical protein
VTRKSFIRKDAGFENKASTARSGLGRLGYVSAGRWRGVAHAWQARLPLNFLPKPLAKSFTPNTNSPYNTADAGCMGYSCSLRATYLRSLHQAAPDPKCYNNTLVGKVSDYIGENTRRCTFRTKFMCETYTAIFVFTHTLPVRCRQSNPVPTRIHTTIVVKASAYASESTRRRWISTGNRIDQFLVGHLSGIRHFGALSLDL